MKLVRTILAGVLLLSMILSLASCGSSLGGLEETVETATETVETVTEEETGVKPKKLSFKDHGDKLRLIGERTNINDSGLLVAEWCGSGFEVNVNIEEDGSDVSMGTRFNYASYWIVYLDGERLPERIKITNGNKDTVIVSGISAGEHTIRVIKDTQMGTTRSNYNNILNLTLCGTITDQTAPDQKEMLIEFVGDGYFTGFGALGNEGSSSSINDECSFTASLPYLVSEKMDADYSVVAHSQIGMVLKSGAHTIQTLYAQHNAYRDEEFLYTPERTPDVIVIHVGMDDTVAKLSRGDFILRGEEFIQLIRSYYGKDVPVVWVYGTYYVAHRVPEIKAMASRMEGVYAFEAEYGQSGSGGTNTVRYPNAEEHQKSADKLVTYLQDLLKK